ncbi:hypothetical protein JL100_033795 (plasmid) [Skermanella mucosa]|uniref:hypothetical protein n=1 Tax=Skermanella mucosa TaxID=1789672 RepID=UPI00192CCEE3|nr:hypothetical protein [Skermanella mucosa]UEM25061.1 hypothetical protein JL100_033795 [Skermanella mucosa]
MRKLMIALAAMLGACALPQSHRSAFDCPATNCLHEQTVKGYPPGRQEPAMMERVSALGLSLSYQKRYRSFRATKDPDQIAAFIQTPAGFAPAFAMAGDQRTESIQFFDTAGKAGPKSTSPRSAVKPASYTAIVWTFGDDAIAIARMMTDAGFYELVSFGGKWGAAKELEKYVASNERS